MLDQDHLFTSSDPSTRIAGALCPVLCVWGSSGGSGSTLVSLVAGELASAAGNLRKVIVVDACREKGDVRTFLRVRPEARVPSLTTSVISGRVTDSIVPAESLNGMRKDGVPDVSFGVVMAPEYTQVRDTPITNHFLLKTIHQLRLHSDLIIVDCGSVPFSTDEESQLFLLQQLMQEGAYGLGLCLSTSVSVRNLVYAITLLERDFGIGSERSMMMMNQRMPGFSSEAWDSMRRDISTVTTPLDPVSFDATRIYDEASKGKLPTGHAELSSSLGRALLRITGNPVFESLAEANSAEAHASKSIIRTQSSAGATPSGKQDNRRIPFGRRK